MKVPESSGYGGNLFGPLTKSPVSEQCEEGASVEYGSSGRSEEGNVVEEASSGRCVAAGPYLFVELLTSRFPHPSCFQGNIVINRQFVIGS